MKKIYSKPEIEVIHLKQQTLLAGSNINVTLMDEDAGVTGDFYNDAPVFEVIGLNLPE